jgi:hypothetical protein
VLTWVFSVSLSDTDTAALNPGAHYHQCKIIDGIDKEIIATGYLIVRAAFPGVIPDSAQYPVTIVTDVSIF